MDGGAWWAAVHGVAKSQTRLSDFTFTFHFHALEKEMETHSSVLAWRIPGTGEPGGLPIYGVAQSRTRLKWLSSSSSSILKLGFPGETSGKESTWQCRRCKRHRFYSWVRKIPWRRKWQPTWTEEPGRPQSRGCKELDTTESLSTFWNQCPLFIFWKPFID